MSSNAGIESVLSEGRSGLAGFTLADEVRAATTETGTTEDVTRFLHDAGHSPETIDDVLRSLDLNPMERAADNDADCAGLDTSRGPQRLRMLARLESLLAQE
jgi:hypothetical protein